ncbi:hypothetical protein EV668_4266 [Enterovirga rhinocerotis]|uniref:Uncharacterized protein n=1 Tax=Enterovirga rhinocerotis TaxID=1339210 RepID=A0A4R7BT52_9HYPH|nr:hypothetical protein EV668_4266 [Enterovirga rhinocerotis]
MVDDLKSIWDSLKAKAGNPPDLEDPHFRERIDAVKAAIDGLFMQFQRERDHRPFDSQAPCPICGGTVVYWYRAPLIGGMKCDTPDCISGNL